jgi:hypothetical protein
MTTGRTGVGQQLMLACGPLGSADGAMRYGSLRVVTCRDMPLPRRFASIIKG